MWYFPKGSTSTNALLLRVGSLAHPPGGFAHVPERQPGGCAQQPQAGYLAFGQGCPAAAGGSAGSCRLQTWHEGFLKIGKISSSHIDPTIASCCRFVFFFAPGESIGWTQSVGPHLQTLGDPPGEAANAHAYSHLIKTFAGRSEMREAVVGGRC